MPLRQYKMMPKKLLGAAGLASFLLVAAVLLASCGAPEATTSPQPGSEIALAPCKLASSSQSFEISARCGTLTVFEDPQAEAGRQIELNIAVVPAISRNPQPDPIFLLAGGPGQSAVETFPALLPAFQYAEEKRDIVLVDQRGTGGSAPLACPMLENLENEDLSEAEVQNLLQQCLEEMDADPALYTTSIAAADLEQVRQTLGYEKINLYGLSYGTRLALTYLRQYPEHVRTVTLDGVVPQDEVLGLDVAQDAQRALDLMFARCAADPACSQAFPDLEHEFQELISQLEASPAEVSLPHPRRGETVHLKLTAEILTLTVRMLTYNTETVALLPLLIHTAYTEGRLDLLAAQYLIINEDLTRSISAPLGYSVLCAEDVPFFSQEQAEQANQNTYLGNSQTDGLLTICEVWPRGEAPAGFKDPVQSDTPVLILSGEMDPVTPPENGEIASQSLPNSLHLVLTGQGHNTIYRGCLPLLFSRFLEAGSVAGLDSSCTERIGPMPFFINFSGSEAAAHSAAQPAAQTE